MAFERRRQIKKKDKMAMMWGLGLVLAAFVVLAAFIMLPPLSEFIDLARTTLDCNNVSISLGEKITCLSIDLYLPYFVLITIFAVAGYIIIKGAS